MDGANLTEANLTNASLRHYTRRNVNFTGANLTNADFRSFGFPDAKLTGADARGAKGLDNNCPTNFVHPDGLVLSLDVPAGKYFRVRDYDGLDTNDDDIPDTPLGITVASDLGFAQK